MTTSDKKHTILRRKFLSGAALAAGAISIGTSKSLTAASQAGISSGVSYAKSEGYLVYDSRICLGCQSCMFACSMMHEGEANPSLSRIQIIRDAPSFTKYPYDIVMSVCRQCVTPLCVQNCPTGACHVEAQNGNVRMIDESKCIGCQTCIRSCPQRPHRPVWNPAKRKSTKCDLCFNTPFWKIKGGVEGNQACVEICPAGAVKRVAATPNQEDIDGYDINLVPDRKSAPRIG
ncbi:MAG: 4Fe-4S dicluster domain-containing protein [Acidobacteriota bacterium]